MSSPIRLTPTSYIVLALLNAAGEATPYDLKQVVAAGLGDFWSIQHAQLYSEPERLAKAGYLRERRENGGRRRRHYRVTDEGKTALKEWLEEPTDKLTELRDLGLLKIFFGADPKVMAGAQLPAHRRKLAEYEALREELGPNAPAGSLLALEVGLKHEREWVGFWSKLAG